MLNTLGVSHLLEMEILLEMGISQGTKINTGKFIYLFIYFFQEDCPSTHSHPLDWGFYLIHQFRPDTCTIESAQVVLFWPTWTSSDHMWVCFCTCSSPA